MSKDKKRDRPVYSYLSEEEELALKEQAEKEYRSVSVLIRIAITEYLSRNTAGT